MISAEQALARLKEGNRRFVAALEQGAATIHSRPLQLVGEQAPFAIILGCSDSRVPAEIVFDQGLGDLFVIRVAGNIVAPSQIGSIELAASQFGTPLVVVLGHTDCGAVRATIEHETHLSDGSVSHLDFIVKKIRPCVDTVLTDYPDAEQAELIRRVVKENVRSTVRALESESAILKPLLLKHRLLIIGAEYALDTGRVRFMD